MLVVLDAELDSSVTSQVFYASLTTSGTMIEYYDISNIFERPYVSTQET